MDSSTETREAAGQEASAAADALEHNYKTLLGEYKSVYDLVQTGAVAFAQKRFEELNLGDTQKRFEDLGLGGESAHTKLRIDIGALEGRLAKDRALAIEDEAERIELLNHAADIYEAVFEQLRSDYPLVNVAALRLWAGDRDRSRRAAQMVLDILAKKPQSQHEYWHFVTLAEAHLLIGDPESASREIEMAASYERKQPMVHWQAFASTSRQLRRSCRLLGVSDDFLAPLRVPPLIVYVGDRPCSRFAPEQEPALAAALAAKLAAEESHIGIGSLAAGAEILFAEALLARGADLHVVLPFTAELFIAEAVAPYGADWIARFNRCLKEARTVKYASNYGYQGHAAPRYACRLAMGQAILRARSFDTSAIMLAACDPGQRLTQGLFDPMDDAIFWGGTDRRAFLIRPDGRVDEARDLPPPLEEEPEGMGRSINAAVLFGDLHGFSSMPESSVLKYADHVLGGIGEIFDSYGTHLLSRNSWGDAIFAQFDNVPVAARCAVDVQSFLKQPGIAELDPGVHMSMRIGLHYGPVQKVYDRVQKRDNYMGINVVQAARIEPIAVPGMTYVSEAFAAALAIDAETGFVCDYLGLVSTAKKFNEVPLYTLRARNRPLSSSRSSEKST